MALNHDVHIPEVMSIIFLLAFYSQPTIKITLLWYLPFSLPMEREREKGMSTSALQFTQVLMSRIAVFTCFVDTRWVTGTSRNL